MAFYRGGSGPITPMCNVEMCHILKNKNYFIVFAETIRRTLRNAGLQGRTKVQKPLLTERHRKLWQNFAKKYKE